MNITQLNNAQLEALIAQTPDLQLVDVRTPEEYVFLGHIPGAKLLPIQVIMDRWQELDPARPTAIVCEHGVRSMHSCYYLMEQGFTKLYNLTDGMAAWTGARQTTAPEEVS